MNVRKLNFLQKLLQRGHDPCQLLLIFHSIFPNSHVSSEPATPSCLQSAHALHLFNPLVTSSPAADLFISVHTSSVSLCFAAQHSSVHCYHFCLSDFWVPFCQLCQKPYTIQLIKPARNSLHYHQQIQHHHQEMRGLLLFTSVQNQKSIVQKNSDTFGVVTLPLSSL